MHAGYLGVGNMGQPMAGKILDAGHTLSIYDVSEANMKPLLDRQARRVSSVKELGDTCETVFVSLPTLKILRDVVLTPAASGGGGLIEGSKLKLLVNTCTVGVPLVKEMEAACAARGITLVDCPISGGPEGARAGTLSIMASGDAKAIDAIRPLVEKWGKTFVVAGDKPGAAQVLKLTNNVLAAVALVATCEAFVMGAKGGLSAQVMYDAVNAGSGRNIATMSMFPNAIFPRKFDYGAPLHILVKDVDLCIEMGEDLGVPMWVCEAARLVMKHAVFEGRANLDMTQMIEVIERGAGFQIPRSNREEGLTNMTTPTSVGYLGVGNMGLPMATQLMDAGTQLTVFDIKEASLKPFLDRQARKADSPKQMADTCATVFVSLPTLPALRDVCLGTGGAENGVIHGKAVKLLVNTCTVGQPMVEEIAAACTARGITLVDCPISGGPPGARAGTLSVMVSGDPQAIERIRPLISRWGKVVVAGDKPGLAQVLKLTNNILSFVSMVASAEAFVMGGKGGVGLETMLTAINAGSGRNSATQSKIPLSVADRSFKYGAEIDIICKDADLAIAQGEALGVPMWVCQAARLVFKHLQFEGRGREDLTTVVQHIERIAHYELPKTR